MAADVPASAARALAASAAACGQRLHAPARSTAERGAAQAL
jgi:hypothetical protein